jgi:hypothetical protein
VLCRPQAFDGRRPALNTSAGGVTGRSRVCSTFTSVAEINERFPVRRRPSAMEGAPDRAKADTVHAVRREAIQMGRQRKVGSRAEVGRKRRLTARASAFRSE